MKKIIAVAVLAVLFTSCTSNVAKEETAADSTKCCVVDSPKVAVAPTGTVAPTDTTKK